MNSHRILLVDDHVDTLTVLSRLLKRSGHAVLGASTAAEAEQLVQANTFDLLLIDLGLPDRDGRELLRTLRSTCDAPAIALTGFGMDGDIDSCRDAGFAKHLTKPVAFDVLLSAVNGAARRARHAPSDVSAQGETHYG